MISRSCRVCASPKPTLNLRHVRSWDMWVGFYTASRITLKSTMAGGEKSSEKKKKKEVQLLQGVVQQNTKIFKPQ